MDWTPGPKGNNFPARCLLSDNLIHTIGTVEKQTAESKSPCRRTLR
jgi:hypothetical protein